MSLVVLYASVVAKGQLRLASAEAESVHAHRTRGAGDDACSGSQQPDRMGRQLRHFKLNFIACPVGPSGRASPALGGVHRRPVHNTGHSHPPHTGSSLRFCGPTHPAQPRPTCASIATNTKPKPVHAPSLAAAVFF